MENKDTNWSKRDGRAFVGYVNDTPHYLFRKIKNKENVDFDIENENLNYTESFGMYGMQCSFDGNHPNYDKIMQLCQKAVEIIKEIDKLNKENEK